MHSTIEIDVKDSMCTALLRGDFDFSNISDVEAAIAPQLTDEPGVVQFDLGGVTFMDSTGIKWLLDTERSVAGWGGRVAITAMSDPVRRLFDVTGLLEHFALAGTPVR